MPVTKSNLFVKARLVSNDDKAFTKNGRVFCISYFVRGVFSLYDTDLFHILLVSTYPLIHHKALFNTAKLYPTVPLPEPIQEIHQMVRDNPIGCIPFSLFPTHMKCLKNTIDLHLTKKQF